MLSEKIPRGKINVMVVFWCILYMWVMAVDKLLCCSTLG